MTDSMTDDSHGNGRGVNNVAMLGLTRSGTRLIPTGFGSSEGAHVLTLGTRQPRFTADSSYLSSCACCGHSPEACPGAEIDSQNMVRYRRWLEN
jgi:hypothetical protein